MNLKKRKTIKTILIGVIVLPIFGLLYDSFSGFYVLRNFKTIYGILAGLMVTVIFAFAGEYVSGLINAKDSVSDPLCKRFFHLFILLATGGVLVFLYWLIFHYLEKLKI